MISGIAISGDSAAGQFYVPRAQAMLANLVARAKLAGVAVLRDAEVFDDSAYCYCVCAGEVHRAVIVIDKETTQTEGGFTRSVITNTPDFYSGAVLAGIMKAGENGIDRLNAFWPTAECADLFGLSGDIVTSRKLAVEPYGPFLEELKNARGGEVYSQYVKLKPTMYSGLMRKVVQLLMGFGRQTGKESIYDAEGRRSRVQSVENPTKYQRDVSQQGLQIRYDWRFYRTHGIYRSESGVLWLVEVGQRGVLAMPLPLHPETTTDAFLEKLERMDDSAAKLAIQEFGGFPTGESMPGMLESWIRAGIVLRLLSSDQMFAFYRNQAYSTQLGWAFNSSGNQIHHTCWRYMEDGVQTGFHYSIFLTIGDVVEVVPAPNAARLKRRFASLVDKPDYQSRYRAVMAKIDRMPEDQINLFFDASVSSDFDALDAITIAPQANGSANLSLVGSGRLMYRGRRQPHFKFPEPDIAICFSHDMNPQIGVSTDQMLCDTIVHVFFAGDELRYLKFFYDPEIKQVAPPRSDLNDCMYRGEWSSRTELGGGYIPAMVYSSEFDDRAEIPSAFSELHVSSTYVGIKSIVATDFVGAPYLGLGLRTKAFRRRTVSIAQSGIFLAAVSAVPFYDRCAYYYTRANGAATSSRIEEWSYEVLTDPWGCNTWRNFLGYTGFASMACVSSPNPMSCWARALHPDGCGPVEARTGMEPSPIFLNTACPDDADSGPWCGVCSDIDSMVMENDFSPLPAPQNEAVSNKVVLRVFLVSESDHTPKLMDVRDATFANYSKPWFHGSPDPLDPSTLYVEATNTVFGTGNVLLASRTGNAEIKAYGDPQIEQMKHNVTTFIGAV